MPLESQAEAKGDEDGAGRALNSAGGVLALDHEAVDSALGLRKRRVKLRDHL